MNPKYLSAAEMRSKFKVGDMVCVTIHNLGNPKEVTDDKIHLKVTEIDPTDNTCTLSMNNWWYDNQRVLFHFQNISCVPEIEPGMHALDENGVHWLAIKQSRLSSDLSWFNQKLLAGTYRIEPDSPAFRENISLLFDVDNESGRRVILWDKKKSKQIQELSEKQKQLTAELEAVNAQLAQIK